MPTSTLFGWALANHGPLTTTFTAPTSCFTDVSRVYLATKISDENNSPYLLALGDICTTPPSFLTVGDCFPSGKAIDSEYASLDPNNPAAGSTIDYYSPGFICPSGYTTAGVAANDAGTITSSGAAFVPPASVTSDAVDTFDYVPLPDVLLQALDQGETAVVCCPSSYTVSVGGFCWSTLPSYPVPSGACAAEVPPQDVTKVLETVSVYNTTITADIDSYIVTSPFSVTETQTITDPQDWIAITVNPGVMMIHNAAQQTMGSANPTTTGSTKSAASRGLDGWNGQNLMLSCWAAILAVGLFYVTLL